MGDSDTDQQLSGLIQKLTELKGETITIRESFSNDYRKLDSAVSTLTKYKKLLKEIKGDTAAAKKSGHDVSEIENVIKEIEPTINQLNQRLVPATGR